MPAYTASSPEVSRGFQYVTTKTLRKSVRQNTVQIYTASTFPEFYAHFITIDRQTKIASMFRRPTALGYKSYGLSRSTMHSFYGLTKSAKHRQHVSLTQEKWWPEMTRPMSASGRVCSGRPGRLVVMVHSRTPWARCP